MIQDSFEKEVCMYINDCKQYLEGLDVGDTGFEETVDREKIIEGLKELKDLCMIKGDKKPLPWKKAE